MDDNDLETAWLAVDAANTELHWSIGRPGKYDEMAPDAWQQYAFADAHLAMKGTSPQEWTAVSASEAGVLLEMARGLRKIGQGARP